MSGKTSGAEIRETFWDVPVDYFGKREPVPEGLYELIVAESVVKFSKDGTPYVNYRTDVTNGEQKGRRVYDNLFFTRKSAPRTATIVTRMLGGRIPKKLASVDPSNLEALAEATAAAIDGATFKSTVTVEPAEEGSEYGPKNRITPLKKDLE